MRRAKIQALDAINSLCLDVRGDEDNVSDVLETLEENPADFDLVDVPTATDEFEACDDELLNETHLCDIDEENICDEEEANDCDMTASLEDFNESNLTS